MSEVIAKIATKTVCGKVAKPTKATALFRVFGIINGSEVKETSYGQSTKFKGQFKAVNFETGEEFVSGAAYLPGVAESLLAGVVGDDPVEFALDIGIKPADNNVGYEYTVKPLIKPAESDPLEKMSAALPALPAPSKGGKKTSAEKAE